MSKGKASDWGEGGRLTGFDWSTDVMKTVPVVQRTLTDNAERLFLSTLGWLTAFVDAATITIGKNGGFFGSPPFYMGIVGQGVHDEELCTGVRSVLLLTGMGSSGSSTSTRKLSCRGRTASLF